ncbi:MAG: AAA family ATPase [Ardenticatenaceae bacterium]|nr:AAA family ATPase [Ardenticatenaceae bacterium]
MKIKSITIKNIKSFKELLKFELDENLNILIGPNGSGKSNFLDILTIFIRRFLIKSYRVSRDNGLPTVHEFDVFRQVQNHLEKFLGDSSESTIEIILLIKKEDIENIANIKAHIQHYEALAKQYNTFPDCFSQIRGWDPSAIYPDQMVKISYKESKLMNPEDSVTRMFLEYLNFFEIFLLLSKDLPNIKLYSNYLYLSPYRNINTHRLEANLSERTFSQEIASQMEATSKQESSLVNIATLHFAEKRRRFEKEASTNGYVEMWEADEEVKLLTKYLSRLDYGWNIKVVDTYKNKYELILLQGQQELNIGQASSGEKEIINFLLGVFAFNLKNGIFMIDEPELHLHPRWQKMLLALFIELAQDTQNQFIITTHSPTFINDRSYSHVIRLYKNDQDVSQKAIAKGAVDSFKLRDILHIINSTNNEKIFFADLVVLVEGLADRLVSQKLFEELAQAYKLTQTIEVVEVRGKINWQKFKVFLDSLKIPSFFITDLDFLNEDESQEIKSLFETNRSKISQDVIKNPKSKDGDALVDKIEQVINGADKEELFDLWQYIKSFRRKLKPNLTEPENDLLKESILQRKREGIFVLEDGDIEDYFPAKFKRKDMDNVISLLTTENYEAWKSDKSSLFSNLLLIAKEILMDAGYLAEKEQVHETHTQ